LDQVRLLDLLAQGFVVRRLQIHGGYARGLTPRPAQESASQSHPSQMNRTGSFSKFLYRFLSNLFFGQL
jgi:hypothetical protein